MRTVEKGSTLLEVAIMMPLFLFGLFFILWVGYIVNTKNALVSAVENGVRLASTRGKPGLFQGPTIATDTGPSFSAALQALDNYYLDKDRNALGQTYIQLLEYNMGTGTDFEHVYRQSIDPIFTNVKQYYMDQAGTMGLSDLPVYYTYALAYINKAMRMTVGDQIRYPCDPRDPADPQGGEYCLFCRPINPLTMKEDVLVPTAKSPWTVVMQRIAIKCDFKPGGFITRPLLAMLSWMTQAGGTIPYDGVMQHITYFDSYESCEFQPHVDFPRYCCRDYKGDPYCF